MRRIASLFVPLISIAISVAACDDDDKSTPTPTNTSGGDTTQTGDSAAPSDSSVNPSDAAQTTSPADSSQPNTTTAQDTTSTTPDTTQPDEGEGLCPGILDCAGTNCQNATTQEEFNECFQDCAAKADSQSEIQALQTFLGCQNTCVEAAGEDPTPEEEKGIYTCLLEDCAEQATACQAGADFGTKTCSQLNGCMNACGATGTARCQRDCYEQSTESAATTFLSINFCLLSQCADKSGAALNSCVQSAQGVPPCKTYIDQCLGDVGAAPGAGGGGGAEFKWDMRAFKAWSKNRH